MPAAPQRANNLAALRLFAAVLVLVGHAYTLKGEAPPLFLSTVPLGLLGISIFFVISGYLVTESWDRDPQPLRFLARRSLRIFPGLLVCVALSALALGPWLTTLPQAAYWAHSQVAGYFTNVGLYITYGLPGVFERNPVPHAVNGSLWSLPVEFSMYLAVAVLGLIRSRRWVYLALGIASAVATSLWAWRHDPWVVYAFDTRQLVICGTYFWMGAAIYKFRLSRHFTASGLLMALVALICLQRAPLPMLIGIWVLLPMLVIGFAEAHAPWLSRLTGTGDYSYGVYIYAFPVQQTLVSLWPAMDMVAYIALTLTLSLALAAASWHLVERPALRLKPGSRHGQPR